MRLLEIDDRDEVHLTSDLSDDILEYAILSHTWGPEDDEVTYSDIQSGQGKGKQGYVKIRFCIEQCRKAALRYFWVDTCCIDRSDSTVVARAIASMYEWYNKAKICYVFLSDISSRKRDREGSNSWESTFQKSKWFTRGWTLQELLAPMTVEFFSREGDRLGDKKTLEQLIYKITTIPLNALRGAPMAQFTEIERFRWADHRQTKYPEDESYCLQGLFGVYISTSYGEGREKARERLKDEINRLHRIQLDRDQQAMDTSTSCGVLRHSNILASNNSNNISLQDRRKMLLDSLGFVQMDARRDTIKKEHYKTCRWLLGHSIYLDWTNPQKLDQHCGFLWINGKPGAGKSTLMKFAHDDADKKRRDPEILLSFFFNARGDELEKSTIGMYRALLFQLFNKVPDLQQLLDSVPFASTHSSQDPVWTVESLCELFSAAAAALGQRHIKCFVDALDECDEKQVQEMVDFFIDIGQEARGKGTQLFVCFASRPYPIVEIESGLQLTLEDQQGHGEDMAKYIQSRLRGKGKEIEELRRQVQEKANGVFMWVVLVVPILTDELKNGRVFAVKKKLQQIPAKLSDLFKDILKRDRKNMPDMLLCLQWILFAKRPLRREEFYHGMVAGVDSQQLAECDPDLLPTDYMDRYVLSSSKGLAEVTKSKKATVQFIHESVRDFLIKDNGLWELWRELQPELHGDVYSASHEELKRCCQTYLNNINIDDHAPTDEAIPHAKSQAGRDLRQDLTTKFPFLEYASRHVLHHANEAAKGISQAEFLRCFPLGSWIHVTNLLEPHNIRRHTSDATILYILAEQNLTRLISTFPQCSLMVNTPGERYRSPLLAAFENGHQPAAKALLAVCTPFDINLRSTRGLTALSFAVKHGYEEFVGRLLAIDGIDVDTRDNEGFTPLIHAASEGQKTIVKLLLENHANIEVEDSDGRTALVAAAEKGHIDVVQLLLEKGANIEAHIEIVQLLLEKGANTEAKNYVGSKSLVVAAEKGYIEIVRLLLEKGADTEVKNSADHTALVVAAERGYIEIVQLLLEKGANTEAKNYVGSTSLVVAAERGDIEVVQLLLEKGANIDTAGKNGQVALFKAAGSGYVDVVRLLLENGANTEVKNIAGYTALIVAAQRRYIEVVRLLLENGANIEAKTNASSTALIVAAQGGYIEVVRLLLENGANIEGGNQSYKTPLAYTAQRGYIEVVRLLLEKGANIEGADQDSCTPLAYAAQEGHIEVLRLLLEKGANIEGADQDGWAPLTCAAQEGHIEVVRLLLEKGAKTEGADQASWTPLDCAAEGGHVEVVRLLLEKGANIGGNQGYKTPLDYAAQGGHIETVQLLQGKRASGH